MILSILKDRFTVKYNTTDLNAVTKRIEDAIYRVGHNGEIPVEAYNKDIIPVITDSKLAPGAKLNDAAKATMKDYIDLTLECYSAALAQEGLGLTMADVGYAVFDVK